MRDGISEEDVATKKMGIAYSTYRDWKAKFPAFSAAVKKGREVVAEKVEDAFYSRCEWQDTIEQVVEETYDNQGQLTGKKRRVVKKRVPPDTACLLFALKNLKPGKWRDKPVEQSAEDMEKHDALIAAIRSLADD